MIVVCKRCASFLEMQMGSSEKKSTYRMAIKGAPEQVFDACTDVRSSAGTQALDDSLREHWLAANHALAG